MWRTCPECQTEVDVPRLADGSTQCPNCGQSLATTPGNARSEYETQAATESPAAPLPERFGRYRVTTLLGSGAFGIVYKGFDEQLRRDVAIKVPRHEYI